jgi:hypothetical protein
MLAYAEHWVTRGAAARQRVLAAFEALEPDAEESP